MYNTWKAACTPRTVLGMAYLHAQPQILSAHLLYWGMAAQDCWLYEGSPDWASKGQQAKQEKL